MKKLLLILTLSSLAQLAHSDPTQVYFSGNDITFRWQNINRDCRIFAPQVLHPITREAASIVARQPSHGQFECVDGLFEADHLVYPVYEFDGKEVYSFGWSSGFRRGVPDVTSSRFMENHGPLSNMMSLVRLRCDFNGKDLAEFELAVGSGWDGATEHTIYAMNLHVLAELAASCGAGTCDREALVYT